MFIEIKNNELIGWATWEFQGSKYFDADFDTFDPKKYEVQNGELVDISLTQAYSDSLKNERIAYIQKNCIRTSVGYLRRQTKAGDLLSIFNSYSTIVGIENVLPAGVLLIYNEEGESFFNNEMSFDEFNELFKEVANAYLQDFKEE